MKNFKFRAWDVKERKMCKVKIINLEKGCFLVGNSPTPDTVQGRMIVHGNDEGHFVNFDDLVLMQYAGKNDKDGNEIFVGDILKRSREKSPSFVAIIEFRAGQYGGVTVPHKNHWIEMPRLDRCDYNGDGYDEIIGNIYENPELLNIID